MKFVIRDDDTCAFTTVSELEKCYRNIWDHIPVNLSITPFRIPGKSKSVPAQYHGQTGMMQLGENSELVQFLRFMIAEKRINIALHGYNHTKPNNLPEYIGATNLTKKTREGKEYLQQLLRCKIDTFVPPNNGIAKEGIAALIENNLHLVGLPSLIRPTYRKFRVQNLVKYLLVKYYLIIHKIQYPYVLSVDGHQEVSYFAVTPAQNIENLYTGFKQCQKLNGVFIFATHYHAFDRKMKSGERIGDVLDMFIEKASALGDIEFCTYNQIWKTS